MTSDPYELGIARPARRAISESLPEEVAAATVELITGPLLDNPRRIGQPLRDELAGLWSARLGTEWRVVYRIDESKHSVVAESIQHRSTVHRRR